jgi:hypothetical protein
VEAVLIFSSSICVELVSKLFVTSGAKPCSKLAIPAHVTFSVHQIHQIFEILDPEIWWDGPEQGITGFLLGWPTFGRHDAESVYDYTGICVSSCSIEKQSYPSNNGKVVSYTRDSASLKEIHLTTARFLNVTTRLYSDYREASSESFLNPPCTILFHGHRAEAKVRVDHSPRDLKPIPKNERYGTVPDEAGAGTHVLQIKEAVQLAQSLRKNLDRVHGVSVDAQPNLRIHHRVLFCCRGQ